MKFIKERDYIESHCFGWERHIEVCFKAMDREPLNWIEVVQDRAQWLTFVMAVTYIGYRCFEEMTRVLTYQAKLLSLELNPLILRQLFYY